MYYKNILEVIGNTPLVKINKLNPNPKVVMLAKLEFMNPGGSIKDRIGLPLIERAEKMGRLKKGGTIVEPTSGNTGVGLAMVAAVRGYKTVFVMPDKMSEEKRNLLRAYGSKVVVTPTAVSPEDERSYYRVSDKIASENSNSYNPDQYSNPANPETHYRTTGLEIWEQTEGKITHVVIGMGTGGTISGVGKYLKKKNPKKIIVAVPIVVKSIAQAIKKEVDDLIALDIIDDNEFLGAVGAYYDQFNQFYTKDDVIALIVSSTPALNVNIEKSELIESKKEILSINLVNRGLSNIKLLNIEILNSNQFSLLSSKNLYIGNLDSDDSETIDLDLMPLKKNSITIPLLITYKDTNNQDYSIQENIEARVYSVNEAKQIGLIKPNGFLRIMAFLVIMVFIYIIYRRRKRKNA